MKVRTELVTLMVQ